MSDDNDPTLNQLRGGVQTAWSAARAEQVLAHIERRKERRQRRQQTAGIALALALLLVPLGLWQRHRHQRASDAHAPEVMVALRLPDGSVVTALSADADIKQTPPTPGRTILQLRQGSAEFRVQRDPQRIFRVEAGRAAVEVLGTRFTVTRWGDSAEVSVKEGRVRVLWDEQRTELAAGERGTFPPEPPSEPAPSSPQPPREDGSERPDAAATPPPVLGRGKPLPAVAGAAYAGAGRAESVRSSGERSVGSWRELAQEGHFERAYAAIGDKGVAAASDEPGDLLLLADIARLSHHPAEAVAPLEKLLRLHRDDPRAALCAFTLGRILLDDLGKPRDAAAAFRDAQSFDSDFALMEDALAREVKALWRAGDGPAARERALEYLRRFPEGGQARAVRRFGGID